MKTISKIMVGVGSMASGLMAYSANYTGADLSAITIDVLGSAGVEGKAFVSLFVLLGVALVGVAGWKALTD